MRPGKAQQHALWREADFGNAKGVGLCGEINRVVGIGVAEGQGDAEGGAGRGESGERRHRAPRPAGHLRAGDRQLARCSSAGMATAIGISPGGAGGQRGGRGRMPNLRRSSCRVANPSRAPRGRFGSHRSEHGDRSIAAQRLRNRPSGLAVCGVAGNGQPPQTPPSVRIGRQPDIGRHRVHARVARRRRRRPKPSGRAACQPGASMPARMRPPAARDRRFPAGRARPEARSRPARRFARRCRAHRRPPPAATRFPPSSPRICRLPRAVTSMMPLPWRSADSQSPIKRFGRKSSSDRIEPHQQAVAGLHRRGEGRAGAAAGEGVHAATSMRPASAIRAARSSSMELRSGCHRPRRRADRKRSAMTLRRRRVLAQDEGAHLGVAEIGVMHGLDQRAWNGMGGFGEADQPVDGFGEFGGAARTVAHLAGDETRIDGARPHHAATASATERGLGLCGSVVSSTMTSAFLPSAASAAEKPPMKATSAEPSRMSRPGSSPVWTRRSASAMRLCEGAGRGNRLRRRRRHRHARWRRDRRGRFLRALPVAAGQQILDAGAIGAGRGAEDARADLAVAAGRWRRAGFPNRPRRGWRRRWRRRRSARSGSGTCRGTGPICAR